MKHFEVQEKTIRLFILAYIFWAFQDFVGETFDTPLGMKLEKLFKRRFGYRYTPTDKGVMKKEYGKYKPSKTAFALFPGRFEVQYEERKCDFAMFLQKFSLYPNKEFWEIFNNIDYTKEYNKMCEFFRKNITKEEMDYLLQGNKEEWWETPEYACKFLYQFLTQQI